MCEVRFQVDLYCFGWVIRWVSGIGGRSGIGLGKVAV